MAIQLLDCFLIAVPRVYDEGDGPIKHTNVAYFIEKERDRYERKIRKGTIYQVPVGFSEEKHDPIDEGIPNYKRFIGHDAIQQKINEGYKWGNETYHPGAKEGWNYVSREDYGRLITAKIGDQVYFHPSVTEPENYITEINGQEIYRAQVHELISVGNATQGFYILVQPIDEVNETGLSLDPKDKMLEGRVRYCRDGSPVKPGDYVFFQEGSDWVFEVNEERLFAMLEENILMKEVGDR